MLNIAYQEGAYHSPCTLLLGAFDGLHAGHETLLRRAAAYGRPVGIMMLEGKTPYALFTREERLQIFDRAGVAFTYRVPFSKAVKETSAQDFLRRLCEQISVERFICGQDFRFGAGAAGTPDLLKRTGIAVEVCPLLTVGAEKVSSTLVREALTCGRVEQANALLYLPFFVTGSVEHGRSVGHCMGFPTANLNWPENKVKLKQGVYAVWSELDGKTFRGIANYGAKPTFGVESVSLEVYFDGYAGDLYGKRITVYFERFLRDIRTFGDAEALRSQLERDLESIR